MFLKWSDFVPKKYTTFTQLETNLDTSKGNTQTQTRAEREEKQGTKNEEDT